MTAQFLRRVVLPGVLLILVGLFLVARPDSDPPVTLAASAAAPALRPIAQGQDSAVADVRLELLNQAHERVGASSRNPFRFAQRAIPAPARRLPPPQALLVPVLQGPPPPPPIPLRFIGVIDAPARAGGRVAVFSDGRGAVMHGREGDIIEGRYRVLRFGNDSIELAYIDGRGRQTIRLSGQ